MRRPPRFRKARTARPVGVVVAAALAAATSASSRGAVRVAATAAPAAVTVGGRVAVTIAAVADAGERLAAPRLVTGQEHGRWTVLAVEREPRASAPSAPAGARWRATLAAYELGPIEIPPVVVPFTRADGNSGTAATPALSVDVISVLAAGDTRPADIRGPVALEGGGVPSWMWALGALGLVAIGGVAVRRWRARPRRTAAATGAPAPHVWALAELDALVAGGVPPGGAAARRLHFAVSAILRRYVELRWGWPAPERTTGEIARGLPATALDGGRRAELVALLALHDRVKFAGEALDDAAHREVYERARTWVGATAAPAGARAGAATVERGTG